MALESSTGGAVNIVLAGATIRLADEIGGNWSTESKANGRR
jgi:hypothetical protein